jgi:hypothetical protein
MERFDLMKYATNAAFGYAGILAYDVFVLGYKVDGGFAMSDASSFAISTLLSNFSSEILSSVVPYLHEGNFAGMISYPLLNGLIYVYVFDMMTNNKYPGNRDSTSAFLVGSFGSLITRYIESPVLNLFGIRSF